MIQFTDLEVNEHNLTKRCVATAWPIHWTRIEIQVSHYLDNPVKELAAWIEENLSEGKYGIYAQKLAFSSCMIIVLGFESNDDALMFKLLDGHTSYKKVE
jgi:hypothetical protein